METQKKSSQPANKTLTSEEGEEEQCRADTSCAKNEKQEPSSPKQGDFSDPVYKEIAMANGAINQMNRDELRAKCAGLKLDTRGVKDVLKKRLKSYYKRQKLMHSPAANANSDVYFDYICVVDYEATCEENNPPGFLHEIIEFPMVLIDTHTLEIVDSFQEYVKPEVNPQLSEFCVKLTGITQKMVDEAQTFHQVLKRAVSWLQEKELGTKYKYTFLTDGSWDMGKFLHTQCKLSCIRYPPFARKWINIRKSYRNFYKVARAQTKLICMLENLGMEYDGRPHCGLDDSRNIARIAIHMLKDGCQLRVNECLHSGEPRSVPVSAPIEGAPAPQNPKKRN
ncbi:3'-5' exoribonuclease 1-like [Carassius auratus]|uniref:3'-5' exoribonuclease 1 n=1 Tax=Carassius auratus TaxID=7957 RepID=A0A6P6M1T1_CARAU|nr:3'-5' exoribonuclease 1-like [Carassius auratus]XP_026090638.1 3'-5' exoribonuclease 1-like [Carassius auratus]XP_052392459.1 3'-5' exoribonuclease 1 [Carassius gibelio]XP_052392460.1 3'-5' exoribonuclease 1 [Carassius gibelio]